ncbi:MAG: hypothetical protein AAGA53_16990 [Pseudomonadota bacterium]
MVKSQGDIDAFYSGLRLSGLEIVGGLVLQEQHCAIGKEANCGKSALVVGNLGAAMWSVFAKSPEFADGMIDPMNRWTKRVVTGTATDLNCDLYFPFDRPFWPFQRIAQTAMGIKPSPLGLLMHPQYGLWHALRALIVLDDEDGFSSFLKGLGGFDDKLIHPCDECPEKPCLNACPVEAFNGETLDIVPCFSHLESNEVPDCMVMGCRSRDACPVGVEHRYLDAQVQFHMRSYSGRS